MAASSATERSGLPSCRGWATGLTKATFTPRRSSARTRPRQVRARPPLAAVGTTSKVRAIRHPSAGDGSSAACNYAGGVAGDQELLVGRDDERQDRAGDADAPPGVPAVVGIGPGILSQSEEAQPAEYQAAYDGTVFPDAAGEDQCIEPLKPDHQPGDGFGKAVHENLEGQPGPLVSVSGCGGDGAHVAAHAGQPFKPAVDVQRQGELIDTHAGPAGEVTEKARIHVAGTGPHDQPIQRGEAHCGVYRNAAAHRGRAAPIAEVRGDQPELAEWPAERAGGLLADEEVTDAMEPVTSHPVPRVPLLGYCVAECAGRHRLVERGVEYGDLRQVGQHGPHGLDAGNIRRVVQRRQVTE